MKGARTVALVAGIALVAISASVLARAQEEPSPEQLARDIAVLSLHSAAAKGDGPYLLLHVKERRLSLMLKGTVLREIPVLDADVGAPRTLFMTRRGPRDVSARLWEGGRVDPALVMNRRELVVEKIDPDPTGQDEIIPPTPEEAYPAPPRFSVRFADGLEVVVLARTTAESGAAATLGSRGWFGERWETLWPGKASPLRLRLLLDAKDAAELWRSLPQDAVRLLLF